LAWGVLAGLLALVQLPWRLLHSDALRNFDRDQLARELAWQEFVRRPPASIVSVLGDLDLGAIAFGALSVCGLLVAIVFLGSGGDLLIGARGQFGGGGVTLAWPR
ncbi:MAG TPA: hypothetical protein VMV45_15795, partial [Casimicrobiaceae bacterium]|nr:hypothetical protein [Casimicrobiaceae bacterium]